MKNLMYIALSLAIFSCQKQANADVTKVNLVTIDSIKQVGADSVAAEFEKQKIIDSIQFEMDREQEANFQAQKQVTVSNRSTAPRSTVRSTTRSTSSSSNNTSSNTSVNNSTATTTTQKKGWSSTAKGAVIGAGVGAATGAIISKKKVQGAIIGGIAGAGIGAGTGAIIDGSKK